MNRSWLRAVSCLLALGFLLGCTQEMGENGHLRVYERPLSLAPPRNAIARGGLKLDARRSEGVESIHGKRVFVREVPIAVTRELLARGKERFEIYCAACHGYGGEGDGMVVRRGFLAPPSYHSERLRAAPAGHFFKVITEGFGAMYGYAERVADVDDRWAVVAYIRALQLSRHVDVRLLSAKERRVLEQ